MGTMNPAGQVVRRHFDREDRCGTDSPLSRLILKHSAEFKRIRVQPIWLIHPRLRHLNRKSRADQLAREARERAQVQAERSGQYLSRYSNSQANDAPEAGSDQDSRDRRSRATYATEIVLDNGGTGTLTRMPDGVVVIDIIRSPAIFDEEELPTLLKYFTNLDLYQDFPLRIVSKETTPVDPYYDAILQSMECPVCTNLCFPPFLSCENGHLICRSCIVRIYERPKHLPKPIVVGPPSCPSCRVPGPLSSVLNRSYTSMISKIDFKCRQHQLGCPEILTGVNYLAHVEQECTYRVWQCPYCTELLDLNSAALHMIENHQSNFGFSSLLLGFPSSERFSVPMKGEQMDTCFGLFHVCGAGEEFTFMLFQIRTGVLEYAWIVCLIDTPAVAANFLVDVNLTVDYDMGYNVANETVKLQWNNIKVFSAQEEMRNIIENVGMTYKDDEMPFTNFCYPGGKAESFGSKMSLAFKRVQENWINLKE